MKRLFLMLIVGFAMASLSSQTNFDIDFAETNGLIPQTIQVSNLTKGSSVTLQGTDILRLITSPSNLEQVEFNKSELLVFPNPMEQSGYFKFTNPSQALVQIHLHSNDGKLLHHNSFELPQGEQLFEISGVPGGIHIISITTAAGVLSSHITSSMKSDTHVSITFVGNVPLNNKYNYESVISRSNEQSTGIVEMSYSLGDTLLFIGSAEGHVSQSIYVTPTGNHTLTFFLTQIVDVYNPITGKTWMDRNLGASRVAISASDSEAYGDLYQWGRETDGHEKRTSQVISTLSFSDTPGHGNFIAVYNPDDWRNPKNDNLWQGVLGTNNPCPESYRLPTIAEWEAENASWSVGNYKDAFASLLKLPMAGIRWGYDGSFDVSFPIGRYWSSSVDGPRAKYFEFSSLSVVTFAEERTLGLSVRCLKDTQIISLPTVITADPIDISLSTATSGGSITSDGGAAISARGVVWSTSETPTVLLHTKTTNGEGTGSFTSLLTNLEPGTTYYVRAYATNSAGTAYGTQIIFNTVAASVFSTIISPTGKTWMDRNLGASRVATSTTDSEAYGDLYQWGRGTDGHEKRNSPIISTLSSSDTPGHGMFIKSASNSNTDWRSPQNDKLWQGVNGTNNPCPEGFRIPTAAEWDAERISWSSRNFNGAFSSPLKLPAAGFRFDQNGFIYSVGESGYYWSSTLYETASKFLIFNVSNADVNFYYRAYGLSVRCLKNE